MAKRWGFKGTKVASEGAGVGLGTALGETGYWLGKGLGALGGVLVDGAVNAYQACKPSTPEELLEKAEQLGKKAQFQARLMQLKNELDEAEAIEQANAEMDEES